MPNQNRPSPYRAFLLRLWHEPGAPIDNGTTWRFSVEDPRTGERRGFADLETFVNFLQQVIQSELEGKKQ